MNSLSIISSQVDRVIGSTPPQTPNKPDSSFSRGLLPRRDSSSSSSNGSGQSSPFSSPPASHPSSPSLSSPSASPLPHDPTGPALLDDDLDNPADSLTLDEKIESASAIGATETDGASASSEADALLPDSEIGNGASRTKVGRICSATAVPFRWVWSALVCSGSWFVSCFYDEHNRFSLFAPLYSTAYLLTQALRDITAFDPTKHPTKRQTSQPFVMHEPLLMDDEKDDSQSHIGSDSVLSHSGLSRQNSIKGKGTLKDNLESSLHAGTSEDETGPRRSVRIRLFNQDTSPKSRNLKSPTSPSSSLRFTRYPRNCGPPRPLLPKSPIRKTLILDLDETLIHSMSKGGRMSSGHMVEVKLDKQHAILYYVHKRPYCDEFLKKVCKWYNVVVFTASVQEYADPVIDWLDSENKFFSARYYRQHCTYRDGVYVKDLSLVEPDLSKVMIIDNSPVSYIFHKDNAIPIEGWISDPSDLDLLHLIPLLQGLQFATDVRAFLALRMGEAFG